MYLRPVLHGDAFVVSLRSVLGVTLAAFCLAFLCLFWTAGTAGEPDDCSMPTPPANALPFKPDTTLAVRTRKSYASLTPGEITRLRKAYAALRDLYKSDAKDPRGWLQQANVHCWYCGGGQNMKAGEEIHGSWWFFPWHRCYLYVHERILGKLIGDPTFALPYWDWAGQRALPTPFTNPNDVSNPLFDSRRGTSPTTMLPDQLVGTTVMNNVLAASVYQTFMGTDADLPNANGGRLENGPHGAVHLWVGDPSNLTAKFDMGVLATAAQDPIFFAHHANIDRLWTVWLNSASSHTNPTESKWLTHKWNFYDENKQWISISVADVLDSENSLRYTYEGTKPMTPRLLEIAADPMKIPLGTEPLTKKTQIPADLVTQIKASKTKSAHRYVLHIDGIEVPPQFGGLVRVFLNLPTATAKTSIDAPNYVGYFTILPHTTKLGEHAMKSRPRQMVFDIPADLLKQLVDDRQELSVTLVPAKARDEKGADMKLTFKRIYISVE
jgi:polyphenol oxidase